MYPTTVKLPEHQLELEQHIEILGKEIDNVIFLYKNNHSLTAPLDYLMFAYENVVRALLHDIKK